MNAPLGSLSLKVRHGSLVEGDELVLVNASNTNGQLGSGVSAAIRGACGPGFQQTILDALATTFSGPMAPGEVLLTDAGTHPRARWVAHVAVMDYREGFTAKSFPSLELVRRACARLWTRLEVLEVNALSVAMVALGAGTGGLGVQDSTRVAAQTLVEHVAASPASRLRRVTFYGYALHEFLAMASVLATFDRTVLDDLDAEARAFVSRG
jgi:O-acetyl-ADP-ribose deacetylase (regulator of RNase III)